MSLGVLEIHDPVRSDMAPAMKTKEKEQARIVGGA